MDNNHVSQIVLMKEKVHASGIKNIKILESRSYKIQTQTSCILALNQIPGIVLFCYQKLKN